MKLEIVRDQAKSMLGSVRFILSAKTTLTPEEQELIKKYKAHKEVLTQKEVKIPLTGRTIVLSLRIGSLVEGQTFKCNDIAEILEYEKNIKESCEAFKKYVGVMKNFGGKEIIEYN